MLSVRNLLDRSTCWENTGLDSLQSLDDENAMLDDGSSELDEKLKQVEEDLVRVEALESSFHKDESTIRSNFVEAISRFSDLSNLLLSPGCEPQEQHTLLVLHLQKRPNQYRQ